MAPKRVPVPQLKEVAEEKVKSEIYKFLLNHARKCVCSAEKPCDIITSARAQLLKLFPDKISHSIMKSIREKKCHHFEQYNRCNICVNVHTQALVLMMRCTIKKFDLRSVKELPVLAQRGENIEDLEILLNYGANDELLKNLKQKDYDNYHKVLEKLPKLKTFTCRNFINIYFPVKFYKDARKAVKNSDLVSFLFKNFVFKNYSKKKKYLYCDRIEEFVDLLEITYLDDKYYSKNSYVDGIRILLENFPNLKKVQFHNCVGKAIEHLVDTGRPFSRSLVWLHDEDSTGRTLSAVLDHCPSLTMAHIVSPSANAMEKLCWFQLLTEISIKYVRWPFLLPLFNIQGLKFRKVSIERCASEFDLFIMANLCPNLESLKLIAVESFTFTGIPSFSQMTELVLTYRGHKYHDVADVLSDMICRMKLIKILHIECSIFLKDCHVQKIVDCGCLLNLEELAIPDQKITLTSIMQIIESCSELKKFYYSIKDVHGTTQNYRIFNEECKLENIYCASYCYV